MQKAYEETYHRVELDHWWFVSRRHMLRALVVQRSANRQSRILEIGCSGGQFMKELRGLGYGQITGIDISPDAISLCSNAGLDARLMDAQALSFGDESFDVLTASDVLEHLENEGQALREWRRVLKPGGLLIVFVPAFMFLWTGHDEANRHYRRYTSKQLVTSLEKNGLDVERSAYWNVGLFPPVAAIRVLRNLSRKRGQSGSHGDLSMVPTPINTMLISLLRFENHALRLGVNWPFGVSVFALARKPSVGRW